VAEAVSAAAGQEGEEPSNDVAGRHHEDSSGPRLLSETWERALAGCAGDVWTEPQVFREFLGPLNSGPVGDQIGSLRFERISNGTGGDLLLYVPGIDFAGVFAAPQFRGLAAEGYELWRCFVGPEDRTPFARLVDSVEAWIRPHLDAGRRVVLFGESFGGLLALQVALKRGKKLAGLVLVNPATSYGRTPWPLLGRALTALPRGEELPLPEDLNDAEFLEGMSDRAQRSPYAYMGSFALAASVADPSQLGRVFSRITTAMLTEGGDMQGVTPVLQGFLTYPEEIAKLLPPETVRFRLRAWLRDGCEAVGSELRAISAGKSPLPPALLVLSEEDRLLASGSEEECLRPLLEPRCGKEFFQVVSLSDAGHAPLDARVDLAALLRESPICKPPPGKRDYVRSYTPPSLQTLEEGSSNIEPIAEFVSPVFLSRDPSTGERRFGLDGVPDPAEIGRPVIFVGNHQLLALDLGPLVREFLIEKGFAPRGLAHPINFPETMEAMFADAAPKPPAPELLDFVGLPFDLRAAARASLAGVQALLQGEAEPRKGTGSGKEDVNDQGDIGIGENFGIGGSFVKWGAVPVTPRNIFRLMQRGDAVLLFPGGSREACHGIGDKYRLLWPERTDFVRVAARFNAVVVPFGSIGSADNVRILSEEARSLLPKPPTPGGIARLPAVDGDGLMPVSESLLEPPEFPPVLPRLPPAGSASPGLGDRFYFGFGRPVDFTGVDPKDRSACDKVYAELRHAVEAEISWLLEARTRDPYRDFLKRQAFERVANIDRVPREIKAGPLKGGLIRSCGRRAPSFEL